MYRVCLSYIAIWRNRDSFLFWPPAAASFGSSRASGASRVPKQALWGVLLAQVVTLDVIGHGITLSEREAEELRRAAAADAGRSSRQARPLAPSRERPSHEGDGRPYPS